MSIGKSKENAKLDERNIKKTAGEVSNQKRKEAENQSQNTSRYVKELIDDAEKAVENSDSKTKDS